MIAFVSMCAFTVVVWLIDRWPDIQAQLTAAQSVLSNSHLAMRDAMAAGWPDEMARAVGWTNNFFPVAEICLIIPALLLLFAVCCGVRVVKSLIPFFNT